MKVKIMKIAVILFVVLGIPYAYISEKLDPSIKEYTGVGEGYKSEVNVTLKINRKDEIVDLKIKHGDTPEIAEKAVAGMKKRIIEKQTWDVDEEAGATATSEGIKEAVKNALEKNKKVVDKN